MFNLVLISDEEKIFDGKASEVNVLTEEGPVTILSQHEPYMTKIEKRVSIKKENENIEEFDIVDGFLYTNGELCYIVVDR
ncbi:hypothetical protein FACS1894113_3400 [Alphaproteobacteria bacterium]|nr:hypothetical protein FACS1894113_3400 [Alphaproteobacteria bacterium]